MRTDGGDLPAVDVLIVDDDAALRTGVRRLLERQGYRCTEAEEGQQAVELVRSQKPQCVLLDLAMPGLDGLSIARMLRTDARAHGVHINCLTGLADSKAREQARLAGCEEILTKPVQASALLEVVQRQVKRRREELSGLTKTQAEALLDWLETWACSDLEGSYAGQSGFTVRWSWSEGRSLGLDQVRKIIEGP